MKTILGLALALSLASASAFAQAGSDYEFKTLTCFGTISEKPRGMHEDYVYMGLILKPFVSTRRDGTKAKSLAWNQCYGSNPAELRMKLRNGCGSSVWYTGRLKKVQEENVVSVVRDSLNLQLDRVDTLGDVLTGIYAENGTVVGNYFYKLNCSTRK